MFHGKILVGWIMLKESFRRLVVSPIPIIPPSYPMRYVWKYCFELRFDFPTLSLITSFWLLTDCTIPSGAS